MKTWNFVKTQIADHPDDKGSYRVTVDYTCGDEKRTEYLQYPAKPLDEPLKADVAKLTAKINAAEPKGWK